MPGAPDTPLVEPTVLTIGVFDGVHRGHQELISEVKQSAAEKNLASLVITFDPHPMALLAPDKAPRMLTTVERRVELLLEQGVDHVRVLNFNRDMSHLSPGEFLTQVVLEQCMAKHVIVGENFRFGAKAAGDVTYLREHGNTHGYTTSALALCGDDNAYSSTRVRAALAEGDVQTAANILGRLHEIEGPVVRGEQRGRHLGFPTANVLVQETQAAPADGVYAGWLQRANEQRLPAAISVGTNPTFAGVANRRVESYVLDQDDLDLYDETVRIGFVSRIRGMQAFENVDELVSAMNNDVALTREILG